MKKENLWSGIIIHTTAVLRFIVSLITQCVHAPLPVLT